MTDLLYKDEVFKIIGACMEVHNELGQGLLEPIYQEALAKEFSLTDIPFEKEKQLLIYYKGMLLEKKYFADFVCYDKIIVELKAVSKILPEHEAQLINYLKITKMKVGVLVNFGEKSLVYKRFIN